MNNNNNDSESEMEFDMFLIKLKKFMKIINIYEVMPVNIKNLVVSDKLSFLNLLEILNKNHVRKCLIWNDELKTITGVILSNHLNKFFLILYNEFTLNNKNTDFMKFIDTVNLNELIIKYKTELDIQNEEENYFNLNSFQKENSLTIEDNLYISLKKLISNNFGYLLISNLENVYLGLMSEKNILVYIIKNFKADLNSDFFLNCRVKDLIYNNSLSNFETKPDQILLIDALNYIFEKNLNYLIIVSDDNIFEGYIDKKIINQIINLKFFEYFDKPVKQFFKAIKNDEILSLSFNIIKYKNKDLFKEIIQKIIFSNSILINLKKNNKIKGVLTLKELIKLFIK